MPEGIHCETWGAGPPLLLLAGLTQDVTLWGGLAEELPRHFLVAAHDPRGAGRSTASLEGLSMTVMAEDALAVMDGLGIEVADVLGFSMGGMVAQVLAALHPGRVRRLVLASTAARLGGVARAALRGALGLFASGQCLAYANEVLAPWLLGEKALEEGGLVRSMAERRFIPSLQGFSAQLGALEAHDSWGLLPRVRASALCMSGSGDVLIPPDQARAMAEAMPSARHEVLPGLGHMCPLENPRAFLEPVLRFLKG